jgi:hypothetical protein
MAVRPEERRRFGRIQLDRPLPGRLGEAPVRVFEVAVTGFRAAHEVRVPPLPTHRMTLEWDGQAINLLVGIVRTHLYRLAKNLNERSIYHTGLRVLEASVESDRLLRELIAERVMRALDEQKANAHGIPPLAAYMYQPGKGEKYRRCELVDGVWRKSETARPAQPLNGFTIAADVESRYVDMLCETYEHATAEGRRLTKILAELSISKNEGVPVRRYEP